jgi:hypothetical protein
VGSWRAVSDLKESVRVGKAGGQQSRQKIRGSSNSSSTEVDRSSVRYLGVTFTYGALLCNVRDSSLMLFKHRGRLSHRYWRRLPMCKYGKWSLGFGPECQTLVLTSISLNPMYCVLDWMALSPPQLYCRSLSQAESLAASRCVPLWS